MVTMEAEGVEVYRTYILLVRNYYIYKCFDVWLHEPVGFAVKHEAFGVIIVTVNIFLH